MLIETTPLGCETIRKIDPISQFHSLSLDQVLGCLNTKTLASAVKKKTDIFGPDIYVDSRKSCVYI